MEEQVLSVLERISQEYRLGPVHIALLFSLHFLYHKKAHPEPFYVHQKEAMVLAKISSRTTYLKCMKDLHVCGYLSYCEDSIYGKGNLICFKPL